MGSYQTPDGKTVQFTDSQTVQLATDLYQYIEHDYKGSPSVDATRLESIVKNLQSGKPLQTAEWDILNELRKRLGTGFSEWESSGRDGQGAAIPEGSGRIAEAMVAIDPSELSRIREDGGKYKTESTNSKDGQATPPHLHDGGMHDLAHAIQHGERLTDADVKSDPASLEFNVEHLMKHLVSGLDHFSRMGKHLEETPSSPQAWTKEKAALHKLREAAVRKVREGSPHPPPNLRLADPHDEDTETSGSAPVHECGSCDMFDKGRCWGYGCIKVDSEWVCDSWDPDPHWREQQSALHLVQMAEAFKQTKTPVPGTKQKDVATRATVSMVSADPRSPTVCVDFDGVLHQGPHGLPGAVYGDVIKGAPEGLTALKKMGYDIIVLTARVDLQAVENWLEQKGLGKHITEVTNRKPAASAYIDDRGTHFTDWPTAVQAVNPMITVSEVPQAISEAQISGLRVAGLI